MPLNSHAYVKFAKGTPAAWERLADKDNNSLYFIIEEGADKGTLYLGDKQICCSADQEFKDLVGLSINQLKNNDILVYNLQTKLWENQPAAEVLSTSFGDMLGASDEHSGASGLVPQPQKGQEDYILSGSGEWRNPTEVFESSFVGDNVPEEYNSLEKIANWIINQDKNGVSDVKLAELESRINGQALSYIKFSTGISNNTAYIVPIAVLRNGIEVGGEQLLLQGAQGITIQKDYYGAVNIKAKEIRKIVSRFNNDGKLITQVIFDDGSSIATSPNDSAVVTPVIEVGDEQFSFAGGKVDLPVYNKAEADEKIAAALKGLEQQFNEQINNTFVSDSLEIRQDSVTNNIHVDMTWGTY